MSLKKKNNCYLSVDVVFSHLTLLQQDLTFDTVQEQSFQSLVNHTTPQQSR